MNDNNMNNTTTATAATPCTCYGCVKQGTDCDGTQCRDVPATSKPETVIDILAELDAAEFNEIAAPVLDDVSSLTITDCRQALVLGHNMRGNLKSKAVADFEARYAAIEARYLQLTRESKVRKRFGMR